MPTEFSSSVCAACVLQYITVIVMFFSPNQSSHDRLLRMVNIAIMMWLIIGDIDASSRAQMRFSLGHFPLSFIHTDDGSCLYQMAGSKESTLISIPLLSAVGKLQWRRGGHEITFPIQRVKTGWGNVPFLLRDVLELETSLTLSLLLQGFKVKSLDFLLSFVISDTNLIIKPMFGSAVLKYTV